MDYPVKELYRLGGISRAAYYKRLNHTNSLNDILNKEIAEKIVTMHAEHPDTGYRRLMDTLEHDENIYVNEKQVTDVAKFKYEIETEKAGKVYLNAIIGLW